MGRWSQSMSLIVQALHVCSRTFHWRHAHFPFSNPLLSVRKHFSLNMSLGLPRRRFTFITNVLGPIGTNLLRIP